MLQNRTPAKVITGIGRQIFDWLCNIHLSTDFEEKKTYGQIKDISIPSSMQSKISDYHDRSFKREIIK